MRVLIVEDEIPAVQHLKLLIERQKQDIEIVEELDSIKSVTAWLLQNDPPDLAFFDIQLADGLSFEIFDQVNISFPIVFTTAYDEYALKAFEVNSIDYLLKPIREKDLQRALSKYEHNSKPTLIDHESLVQLIGGGKTYKEQFVIKVGDHLRTVRSSEVKIFYSQDRATYLLTDSGKRHILDLTMDGIEEVIDPKLFYRINRKYLIRMDAISDIVAYSNSRLRIHIKGIDADDLVVSRERVTDFKAWLDR